MPSNAEFMNLQRQEAQPPSDNQEVEDFKTEFERIKVYFSQKKSEVAALAREEAPDFNLFRLMGLETSEVQHSRFIASLLDPEGSHGQSYLFLRSFLSLVALRLPVFSEALSRCQEGRWVVEVEKSIAGGRMDIAFWNRLLGVFVVVENKIYAYEQPQQLSRYGHWLNHNQRDFPTQALIYLTLRGEKSYTHADVPYIGLSYEEDILGWLSQIVSHTPRLPVRVHGVLLQYLDTIQSLSL